MSTISLNLEGAQGIAAALGQLSSSVGQLAERQAANTRATQAGARASVSAAAGIGSLAQSAQQGAQRIQGIAGAVQQLTTMMGSEDRAGSMVASVAGATAQFAAMGSMVSPGGALIGGLVGLVAGLVSVATAANDVETAARQAREELESLADARISERDRDAFEAEVASGTIGADRSTSMLTREREITRIQREELAERAEAHRAHIESVREMYVGREIPAGLEDTINRESAAIRESASALRDRERTLRDELQARADLDAIGPITVIDTGSGGGGGGASRADALAETYRRWEDEEDAFYAARDEAAFEATIAAIEAERERGEALLETKRELAASELELEREKQDHLAEIAREQRELEEERRNEVRDGIVEFENSTSRSLDAVISAYRDLQDQAKETGVELRNSGLLMSRGMTAVGNNITDVVGNQMTGAFNQALGAWLDGSKSFVEAAEEMAKGVIKALVQESIVQGVTELARGIADLASYRYDSAALHFGAAAAWAAVGAVAGGIGAATGAFGGKGSGGEGASARDTADADRERERDRAAGPTVVNLYMDGLPVTQSEVGAGVARGLRTAARHGYLQPGALRG